MEKLKRIGNQSIKNNIMPTDNQNVMQSEGVERPGIQNDPPLRVELERNQNKATQPIQEKRSYREPRANVLRDHEIHITFYSIGCMIRIGCKTIPFSTIEEGMRELNEYVADPYTSARKWEKIFQENNKN
jgi:hypothetical protein